MGARPKGRRTTHASKKGSQKVLGRVLRVLRKGFVCCGFTVNQGSEKGLSALFSSRMVPEVALLWEDVVMGPKQTKRERKRGNRRSTFPSLSSSLLCVCSELIGW